MEFIVIMWYNGAHAGVFFILEGWRSTSYEKP